MRRPSTTQTTYILAARLDALADRIQAGERPSPTVLLCIRNTKFIPEIYLQFRINWIRSMLAQRRDTCGPRIIRLLEHAVRLIMARQSGLSGKELARNQQQGEKLAKLFIGLHGKDCIRISHFSNRRTACDAELLAVEFFSRALDFNYIDGTEDYLAAIYCICRQSDLFFRFTPEAVPKLRKLAVDWRAVSLE